MTETATKSIASNKSEYINQIFAQIAKHYDLLNNLMTMRFHLKWKKDAIDMAIKENKHIFKALDLCTGTGDLALFIHKKVKNAQIICIDNCHQMIDITKKRLDNINSPTFELIKADCENLRFNNSSFDLITIGFGLRNLINREKCLTDSYDFLAPEGVFACIDLGHPVNPLWKSIYGFYFYKIIPLLGFVFARNKEAYTYLADSLSGWYKQDELKEILIKIGFKKVYYKNILGGAVA